MPAYSRWLFFFAAFLVLAGVVAFAASGFAPRAKTAIMMGTLTGAIMGTLGYLSTKTKLAKPALGTAIFFALFFGSTFTWRSIIAWQNIDQKLYLAILLTVMACASLATIIALTKMWPRSQKAITA